MQYWSSQFNWIDLVVLGFVAYYIYEGWGRGLVSLLFELSGFILSLFIALKSYLPIGVFLDEKFGVPPGWAKLIAFVGTAIASEWILNEILIRIYIKLPEKMVKSKANRWLGVVPSVINGLIIASFILLVAMGLPLRGEIKNDIRNSKVGSVLVNQARVVEKNARTIFEDALSETAKFITVKPGSSERVRLDYELTEGELTVDPESEARMLEMVNAERAKVGAKALVVDSVIVPVARAHSRDMWERRYFSHINPDGEDPFERMREGGVRFNTAGENLALAPDVNTAHQGLMNSPGHKRNILDPEFGRIGIGVIDGGVYGKMFTQNFAD